MMGGIRMMGGCIVLLCVFCFVEKNAKLEIFTSIAFCGVDCLFGYDGVMFWVGEWLGIVSFF